MVEFCGWEMPVQYPDGVLKEHNHCRTAAALFDVSHMGQLRVHGKDRIKFFEQLVVADLKNLPLGHSTLSVYTTEEGGIIDDTVISNAGGTLYVVINAGCADKDIAHIEKHLAKFKKTGGDAEIEFLSKEWSLIALQGPKAQEVLANLVLLDLNELKFMSGRNSIVSSGRIPVHITRCGYTGEDGFEIAVSHSRVDEFANLLMKDSNVRCAGLGSRDSLRLEAGLCLYGHDLNEQISPVEAGLTWTIGKRRREEGGFLGADVILKQISEGVSRKRVGLLSPKGNPSAREHTPILDAEGKEIGHVTSGTMSPILKQPIAMGYVQSSFSKNGTELQVQIRGKNFPATVSKMPFVPNNYKR